MDIWMYAVIGICPVVGFWVGYRIFKNKKDKKNNK